MNEKKLKEEYLAMEIPAMKTEIMDAIASPKAKRTHRRIRPAAAAVMAMLCLCMLMSAAAAGSMLLQEGSRYYSLDSDGNKVKPNGFHTDEDINAPLSEKALANIAPYVFSAGDPATLYETEDRAEMEEFLDYLFRLPTAVDAEFYRMWACGTADEVVSLYVQIPLTGAWENGSIDVHLRGGPLNILTGSTPKMYDYTLTDGTSVSLASYKTMSGANAVSALYMDNGAVYHITLRGGSKNELLLQMKSILDTVE
ncbi:MAG: hypothetical protein E7662_04015 [Ruminococcaceae bacterium]|nr:hypothetical protein [Oscillospiraceae bacterium]